MFFLKKKYFWVIPFALFRNFDPNCDENSEKKVKKFFFIKVSKNLFWHPFPLWPFPFSQKRPNRCTLMYSFDCNMQEAMLGNILLAKSSPPPL